MLKGLFWAFFFCKKGCQVLRLKTYEHVLFVKKHAFLGRQCSAKPGFNGDSLLFTKNIEHHLLFTKKCFNIKLYIFVTKNIQIGGISVPQLQGFDAGNFLHNWHAFGGESGFRRNNASILRNLPWKIFWKWLHCFEHVFPTCQERSVYFTSVCSSVLFFMVLTWCSLIFPWAWFSLIC